MTQQTIASRTVELLDFSSWRKPPLILQAELAECGLACLAMVAGYHGHTLDIASMRRRFPAGKQGMSLRNLIEVSETLHLSSRALRCPLENIKHLTLPAILHWDLNHFVVLTKVGRNKVSIHDPATGKRAYTFAELSTHYTGVALECRPTEAFTAVEEKQTLHLSQLWGKIVGLKRGVATLLSLSLLLQIFILAMPYYLQITVDEVLLNGDLSLLTVIALGFLFITILNVVTNVARSALVLRLSSLFNLQVGTNVFHHLIRLPMNFFQTRYVGDVLSRFESLHAIRDTLTRSAVESIVDGVMTIGLVLMMFLYNVQLTLIALTAVGLYGLLRFLLFSPLRRRSEDMIQAKAKEQSHFIETLHTLQTVKLLVKESERENIWQNRYASVINTEISLGRLSIGFDAANKTLFGLEHIAIIFFGASAVMSGSFSVGALLAFIAYKSKLTERASMFIENIIQLSMLRLHLSRLSDIVLEDQEANRPGKITRDTWQGELTLENVSFSYGPNQAPIFHDINLKVKSGESIIITGPSGCGKTTLMKIMLGLLEPASGRVLLDGIDIKDIGLTQYRQLIGAVMQDDTLVAGSIMDNITFFATDADDIRAQQSAKDAAIDNDIKAMTMGYFSPVGDLGDALSGGQKQRLLLARALYRSPLLLFLDEATSHLDTQNESLITDKISQFNMTRIAIAHRPETIARAERVVRLEKGILTEIQQETLAKHNRRSERSSPDFSPVL